MVGYKILTAWAWGPSAQLDAGPLASLGKSGGRHHCFLSAALDGPSLNTVADAGASSLHSLWQPRGWQGHLHGGRRADYVAFLVSHRHGALDDHDDDDKVKSFDDAFDWSLSSFSATPKKSSNHRRLLKKHAVGNMAASRQVLLEELDEPPGVRTSHVAKKHHHKAREGGEGGGGGGSSEKHQLAKAKMKAPAKSRDDEAIDADRQAASRRDAEYVAHVRKQKSMKPGSEELTRYLLKMPKGGPPERGAEQNAKALPFALDDMMKKDHDNEVTGRSHKAVKKPGAESDASAARGSRRGTKQGKQAKKQ